MKNIFENDCVLINKSGPAQHQHQTGVKSFIQSRHTQHTTKLPKLLDDGKQNYFSNIRVSVKTNILFNEMIYVGIGTTLCKYLQNYFHFNVKVLY